MLNIFVSEAWEFFPLMMEGIMFQLLVVMELVCVSWCLLHTFRLLVTLTWLRTRQGPK